MKNEKILMQRAKLEVIEETLGYLELERVTYLDLASDCFKKMSKCNLEYRNSLDYSRDCGIYDSLLCNASQILILMRTIEDLI